MAKLGAKELGDIAVRMEKNGRLFYLELMRRAENKETAALYGKLADDEEEHARLFGRVFANALAEPISDQQTAYLSALTVSDIFAGSENASDDPKSAMSLAIEAEKESILFYTEITGIISDDKAKEILARILREEKLHLVELREIYEEDWG